MASLPPELLEHFRAIGVLHRDGLARRARSQGCTRCGTLVLAGGTAEPGAWTVRCDALPLDPVGEVLAMLAGRMTYEARYYRLSMHYELDPRDPLRIRAHPAGSLDAGQGPDARAVVLAEHTCGAPALSMHRPTAQLMAARVKRARDPWNTDGPPPF